METRHHNSARGFSAIEVSIFMIAAIVIATISAVAMLDLGNTTADSGKVALDNGVDEVTSALTVRAPVTAERGDVDIDGNGAINLSGADRQAVVKATVVLTVETGASIDLTPPYVADDTLIDPDADTALSTAIVSLTTDSFSVSSAAWTVEFLGDDNDDTFLDRGERAELTVWLHEYDWDDGVYTLGGGTSDPFVDSEAELLTARGHFTIRIVPVNGPPAIVTRTLPLELTSTLVLE